jgi:hypothetical protein
MRLKLATTIITALLRLTNIWNNYNQTNSYHGTGHKMLSKIRAHLERPYAVFLLLMFAGKHAYAIQSAHEQFHSQAVEACSRLQNTEASQTSERTAIMQDYHLSETAIENIEKGKIYSKTSCDQEVIFYLYLSNNVAPARADLKGRKIESITVPNRRD